MTEAELLETLIQQLQFIKNTDERLSSSLELLERVLGIISNLNERINLLELRLKGTETVLINYAWV